MTELPNPPFEPHRFASAAEYYRAGRAPYPPALIRAVAGAVDLRPPHHVLDLGCGPGMLAIGFAYFAGAVLGLDPEPAMLAAAADAARGLAPNAAFRLGSSQDVGPAMGVFRLAVMGRSFHWMDRQDTLRRLNGVLDDQGAVALFHDTAPEAMPDNAWRAGWRAIIDRYAADDPERRRRRSGDWPQHAPVLLASDFNRLQTLSIIEKRRTPVDSLIARTLSLSSTSPGRLGARTEPMLAELRQYFSETAPEGVVTEILEFQALLAFRSRGARRERP